MCPYRSSDVLKGDANFTLAISAKEVSPNDCWILDSGSGCHICSVDSWFENVRDAKGVYIQLNGEEL